METMENTQKRELEEHVEVLLKMEQERVLMMTESTKVKEQRDAFELENNNYKAKLGLFEGHLNALKDEIKNSQGNYSQIIAQKDTQISELNTQLSSLSKRKNVPIVSSQKSMTGLPVAVLKEKTQSTLKFKRPAKKQEEPDTPSTKSSSSINQFSDKQLVHDNQMLSNELIVLNKDLQKTRSELKLSEIAFKKSEKEKDQLKKSHETLQ